MCGKHAISRMLDHKMAIGSIIEHALYIDDGKTLNWRCQRMTNGLMNVVVALGTFPRKGNLQGLGFGDGSGRVATQEKEKKFVVFFLAREVRAYKLSRGVHHKQDDVARLNLAERM